jgi:hypothetical protein
VCVRHAKEQDIVQCRLIFKVLAEYVADTESREHSYCIIPAENSILEQEIITERDQDPRKQGKGRQEKYHEDDCDGQEPLRRLHIVGVMGKFGDRPEDSIPAERMTFVSSVKDHVRIGIASPGDVPATDFVGPGLVVADRVTGNGHVEQENGEEKDASFDREACLLHEYSK